jgi:hypothetical protein
MIWARGWSGLPSHISIPNTCTFSYPGRWPRKALETCSSLIPPSSALELGVQIREVTLAGLIYILAGTGAPDFSGDGGPENQRNDKQKRHRSGRLGDWFIAEPGTPGICGIIPDGIINKIVGAGMCSYDDFLAGKCLSVFGDGGPATDGRFFERCRRPGGFRFVRCCQPVLRSEGSDATAAEEPKPL